MPMRRNSVLHPLPMLPWRTVFRSSIACILVAQLALPAAGFAQQSAPTQATTAQQPAAQTSEAATKPIEDAPEQPMTQIQGTINQASTPLTHDEVTLQVLNRFTYGPRPGDLEHIRAEGISKWFTEQLNPWKIDDSALDRRLLDYPAMRLPLNKLIEQYPNNAMIRAEMNGKVGIPHGEGEKAIYQAQIQRYEDKRKKGDANSSASTDARLSDPEALPAEPEAILAMDPAARLSMLSRFSPAQLVLLRQRLPQDQRDQITAGFTPHQVEVLAAFSGPQVVVASELIQTKILRDIFSERQLNEIMTDFWLNHFNVYVKKSQQAPYFLTTYERDTIRPRALGNFESLLTATAQSPAMLNYLDNASSIGPNSPSLHPNQSFTEYGRPRPRPQARNASGLNENYARELMELHTLGVNGGYTQQDVTEVAKVFTGWTIGRGRDGGEAVHPQFDASKHEPGNKLVLGVTIKQNGYMEGMQVLHLLASSPQTAHFICTKLAVRFVSDTPPPAMIDNMVAAFTSTHGDIRRVLLAMVNSPQFFSRDTFRGKVKTPQDYVISAVRASGADVQSAGALAASISELGMPIYGMQTPNGYSMRADPWNNTAALISRMNFALALSSNRITGVHTDLPGLIGQPSNAMGTPAPMTSAQDSPGPALVSQPSDAASQHAQPASASLTPELKDKLLEERILHGSVSERTRQTILAQITADPAQQLASLRQITARNTGRDPLTTMRLARKPDGDVPDPQIALAAGLIFGSPEFQRR